MGIAMMFSIENKVETEGGYESVRRDVRLEGKRSGSDFTSMMINGEDRSVFHHRAFVKCYTGSALTRIYVFHVRFKISLYRLITKFFKKISIIDNKWFQKVL